MSFRRNDRYKGTGSERGFSIVELVLVLAIFGTLLSVATIAFHSWQVKYNVEGQVRKMMSDFNELRVMAITKKQKHSITLNPTSYVFRSYSSEDESKFAGQIIADGTRTIQYGLKKSSGDTYNGEVYEIDPRGLVVGSTATIFIDNGGPASMNCITLAKIRINPGKMNDTGTVCNDK